MANQQLKVQTRVCPVCHTVHDLPLCGAATSEEKISYKSGFRYFAECGGQAVELTNVYHSGNGTKARDFTGTCPCGQKHNASRKVWYKPQARRHECDARCLNAQGRVMNCECSCGGKNHGRGQFVCELAA